MASEIDALATPQELIELLTESPLASEVNNLDVALWLSRIGKARQKEQQWRERAKRCVRIYRDDNNISGSNTSPRSTSDNENSFNILWANTETLLPAIFSSMPKPDVRNRYLAQDKAAEIAGQILERVLSYFMEISKFLEEMRACIKDYLLTGRGTMRVRLINMEEEDIKVDEAQIGDVSVASSMETVIRKNLVQCELVDWESLVIEPAKRWKDVNWIAFIHMLSREEFENNFPDASYGEATSETNKYSMDPQYKVYEIWDRIKKKVYYIGHGEKPFRIQDDPYKLSGFFPIPEPIYSIKTNNTLVPIPEYTIYQDQARELNKVSYRISDLVNSCKLIGIYDAKETGLSDLLEARDSQFVPVTTTMMRQGGIAAVLDMLDTSKIGMVLNTLYAQRNEIRSIIYEVTGISDIIRGASQAAETATAQSIKANYAGLRLKDRRDNVNNFIVDLLRIQAEMISTFIPLEQMSEISGTEITPDVEPLLKSEMIQSYKIDIESDSTIVPDMEAESRRRADLLAKIIEYLRGIAPFVQSGVVPMEAAKSMLKYGIAASKMTRELEDAIDMIGMPQPEQQSFQQEGMGLEGGMNGLSPETPLQEINPMQQEMGLPLQFVNNGLQ